MYVLNGPPITV